MSSDPQPGPTAGLPELATGTGGHGARPEASAVGGPPEGSAPEGPGAHGSAADASVPGTSAPGTSAPATSDAHALETSTADGSAGQGASLPDVPLEAVLEALLLVTDEPVPSTTLAQVAERPTDQVDQVLADLVRSYEAQGRGFELRLVAGGWRLYTRPDCAPYVERFLLDGQQARLTQAALETLAVIAYRQPVTRARVSAVRGVNVDGVVRTLQARGLVADAGQDPDSAATLYRTTPLFLERLGLRSLEDLPALAPLLPELDELDDASTST